MNPEDQKLKQISRRDLIVSAACGIAAAASPLRAIASASSGRRSAVVIGAGIAGLSAAHELGKAGFEVSVFEKWDFVGGRMRQAWMGPLWGPPHALGVYEANREMFALAARLGIEDELHGDEGSDEYLVDNGVGQYAMGLRLKVEELQKIPGMSAATVRRLPLLQSDMDRLRATVDPCLMTTGAAEDDETVAAYYRRVLGAEAGEQVLQYWVESVLAAWGWPAESTSKMAILPWFSQQTARVVVPRGDIGVLTRKLASILDVRTRTTVRFISPPDSSGRRTVHYLGPDLQPRQITPDVVVCATEGKYVASLVQGLDAQTQDFFRRVGFTKGGGVTFILDPARAPKDFVGGAYTPRHPDPLKRRVTIWGAGPANPNAKGKPAFAFALLSRPEFLIWQRSGQLLPEYCRSILKSLYPAFDEGAVIDVVNSACDDLIHVPVGYVRRAADIVREQERSKRSLYFAGEYLGGAHTGGACASGLTTARLIARQWA